MNQTNENKKNSWGGRRQGAGRPAEKKATRSIALRIPDDVARILDAQPNRSAYIIEAVRDYHRRRHPEAEAE
ncbi:MAG: hypothetical protein K2I56_00995 [Muribaculaceae bacterium]|nr:hypothetical protein [Muribaculaceae bacterium]